MLVEFALVTRRLALFGQGMEKWHEERFIICNTSRQFDSDIRKTFSST
jgi:hypothetical protein